MGPVMAKTTGGAEEDIRVGTARAAETHRSRTDEFAGGLRSYLRIRSKEPEAHDSR
jgi:hypothetical protein